MSPISRGFGGRRRDDVDASRIPPGQYYERGFPVLSAGPTPRTRVDEWTFSIQGAVAGTRRWTWEEFLALPAEELTVDIHCVTRWSKLDGGYTTNLGLEDVTGGRAWIAYEYDGAPLAAEASRSRFRTSRASGRATATTTTATRGRSSGMRTTERPTSSGDRPR